MFRRARHIIGLDLGASRIKAVVLKYRAGEELLAIEEYAMENMAEGEPRDKALQRLLRRLQTRCRECAVAMWPKDTLLRFFDAEADRQVLREIWGGTADVASLFHQKLPDHEVAYAKLGGTERGQQAVHVACAIPRFEIAAAEADLARIGYRIRIIQLTPLAILNAFAASQLKDRQPFLAVDFGRGKMTVLGFANGALSIIRPIDFPWGEIPAPLVPAGGATDEAVASCDEASALLFQEMTDQMAAEISLFVDSIRMHQDTATLKTIHVSGGVSNHPMAMRQLSEKLGLPCQQWNPIRHVGAAHRALQDFSILGDLAHLPAAAGAAFQCAA